MKRILPALLFLFFCTVSGAASGQPRQKTLSRAQLEHYLARTIDVQGLSDLMKPPAHTYPGTADRLVSRLSLETAVAPCSIAALWREEISSGRTWARYQKMLSLITDLQPALLLDAVNLWGTWEMTEHLTRTRYLVADVKKINPDIVVMGVPNEHVNAGIVVGREIPQYVWDAFGLPNENRSFDCFRMRDSLTLADCNNGFTAQIKHLETRMYYYWLATTYVALGCEAISFSAINWTGSPNEYRAEWTGVIQRIRQYADTCGAVRFVLLTGHSATGFLDTGGNLLFDFHIEPLRPTEDPRNRTYRVGPNGGAVVLQPAPVCPTLYQNGLGGRNPNGWICDRNPGLVYFDNYMEAVRDHPGSEFNFWGRPHKAPRRNPWACWNPYHFDEITWFALQTKAYRDSFLRYAHRRVRVLDTNLHLAIPVKRGVAAGTDSHSEYTCDKGLHYHPKEWWPADYFALDPDPVLFPEPPRIGNYFFAQPDRTRLPLYGGYGQEKVVRELLMKKE